MSNSILDEKQLTHEIIGLRLLEAHQFWLKKRLLFNVLVGVSGLVSMIIFLSVPDISDYFGAIIWGIVANGLFSFGYVCESYMIATTKRYRDTKKIRVFLFWTGTVLYVILSILIPYFSIFLPLL